jgi:mRNA-degrading endonuclease RelE of RelBE toxin-antitoxin system
MNVVLTPAAQEQFGGLPRVIQTRVLMLLERLQCWPEVSGAKGLTGNLAGRHRMRTGAYRVQFHVKGGAVIVEKIGHRDRFYED